MCAGVVVLIGWALNSDTLKSILPGLVAIKANTALAFFLAGVSLWLLHVAGAQPVVQRGQRRMAQTCALLVALVGLLTLAEYLFGTNLGIDQLLFQEMPGAVGTSHPGRMAPNTALNFVLVGIALLLLDVEKRRGHRPAQFLALAAGFVSLMSLIGYAYGSTSFYGISFYTRMALPTALVFTVLCAGICSLHPDTQLMKILRSDSPGGIMARRLLPAAVSLPILLGWLRVAGQRAGLYDTAFGSALVALSSILIFIALIWWNAGLLFRADAERMRVEEALRRSEKWLSTTLTSIGDAVITADMNGAVTFMNGVAQALTGWSLEEARGKSMDLVFDIVNAETRRPVENPVKKVFREGKVAGLADHTVLISKSGREFDIEDSAAPIRTDTGEGFGVVLVFRDITGQKQAAREIKRQKELLRQILASMGDGVVVADEKGKFLLFNAAAEQILGIGLTDSPPDQWADRYGDYLPDMVTPYPSSELPLARAMRGESVDFAEIFMRNEKVPEGRLLSLTARPLRGEDDALRGGVVVFRDITERRRADEALKTSEQRLHLALDAAQMGIWELDLVKDTAYRNLRHDQVFGYPSLQPEWGREIFLTHVVPEDREAVNKSFEEAFATGDFEMECRITWPDNSVHWIAAQGRVFRNDKGDPVKMMGTVADITERKQAEERLEKSEKRLAGIVNSAMDAIVTIDEEQRITLFNPAAEKLFGYPAGEVIGQPLDRLMPSQFHAAHHKHAGTFGNSGVTARTMGALPTLSARRANGEEFPIEATISQLEVGGHRLFTAIVRDVTDRKRAEEALVHAKEEAERASWFKDQFLSTMSHELRTPLNAILGFSELLTDERYGPLNERQSRYINHINAGGKHLLKLISDILDLSKIEAGRMGLSREDVRVAESFVEVLSALQPLADKKSQTLNRQAESSLCVHADATRFKQILMNLVGNAIKFTPEGGRIELAARRIDGEVRVEVRDNGPGIPPEEQQRIFEAFYRRAEGGNGAEGTGLGLAITQRLVEMHGGRLGIESHPGQGTCFYFSLPMVAVTPEQPARKITARSKAAKAPRILVIENDEAAGQLIESQLTSSGYEAVKCFKPEHAASVAAELQPDAITLDLLMKPVHGLEILLQLKNDPRTCRIPVIVVTIVDRPTIGTALGAEEYLVKPVEKAALLAAVERCLRSRGDGAPKRPILVVEDDAATLEMIAELLTAQGYAVTTAADGALARARVAHTVPELVILDLILPQLSGFDLLAEWRAHPRTADLPVFVLTSKDLSKEEEAYIRAHARSLFRKQQPWQEALLRQLKRALTPAGLVDA